MKNRNKFFYIIILLLLLAAACLVFILAPGSEPDTPPVLLPSPVPTDTASDAQDSSAIIRKSRDLLLLRAAEDALRAHLSSDTSDFARGALYVLPADRTLPQDAAVCIRTKGFVFFR